MTDSMAGYDAFMETRNKLATEQAEAQQKADRLEDEVRRMDEALKLYQRERSLTDESVTTVAEVKQFDKNYDAIKHIA